MGFTNRSKTNVARSESWTPAAALQNKLNKLEKEICCNKTYKVTREITNAELILMGIGATPIEVIPAPLPTQYIIPLTAFLELDLNGGGATGPSGNNDIILYSENATAALFFFRDILLSNNDRTTQGGIATPLMLATNTQNVLGDSLLIAVGTGPTAGGNPTNMNALSLRITVYYQIFDTD